MAKKKEEVSKADVKLTNEENVALEVEKTVSSGKKVKEKYRLKDPSTHYAEKDFCIAGNEAKELPESPSRDLVARIRSGFIVKE